MDNLPTHHASSVVQAIEQTGARVWWQPPYSPDLNPIEECWSKLKAGLRGVAARTQEALLEALKVTLDTITPADINGWFQHAGLRTSLS